MKVAITGGSGFLGSYVVEKLLKEKLDPIVLSRKVNEDLEKVSEVRYTDYSLKDLSEKLAGVDAIVHLAAKRGSQGKISEFHDNEVLTQNLYDACIENNIKNVVYASTISVYSDTDKLPWTENHITSPNLMYGVSKLANENIGDIYSRNKGMNIKNLRFAHLYGFNEKNNYMINRFFRQAFHREQLILNATSIAKREFLYAKDAAKAVICALKQSSISGTFNIGSGEAFTNYEVAEIINAVFENNYSLLVKDPNSEEGIHPSYMNSTLAEKVLDFSTDYSFSEAILEISTQMRGLDDVPLWY